MRGALMRHFSMRCFRTRRVLVSMLLLIVPMVAGVGVSTPAAAQEDGKALFENTCQKCHGPDGKGDTKPGKKMNVPVWDESKVEHAHVIENVRTNKKHRNISKKVSDAELDAIATYVATLIGS